MQFATQGNEMRVFIWLLQTVGAGRLTNNDRQKFDRKTEGQENDKMYFERLENEIFRTLWPTSCVIFLCGRFTIVWRALSLAGDSAGEYTVGRLVLCSYSNPTEQSELSRNATGHDSIAINIITVLRQLALPLLLRCTYQRTRQRSVKRRRD